MEVTVVSTEILRPSSPSIKTRKPHKLSLFDQLFPWTYVTCFMFYPNIISSDPKLSTLSETLAHVKKSLSDALNLYYPLSGRIKNDIHVDDFDSGVPFLVATVDCRMKEYFKLNEAEQINKLAPFPPFRREREGAAPIPLLAIQASIFSCGGAVIGTSICHKIADGSSVFDLLSSWAAFSRGARKEVITPNYLSEAALLFPAVKDLPEKYSTHVDATMFRPGSYVTRTFVFSGKAVGVLREKARSERVPNPTRNEAVSCFIWKHATEAAASSSAVYGSVSIANQAVNVRGRLRSHNHFGNLCWMATAVAPGNLELPELVDQLKGAMEESEGVFDVLASGSGSGSGSEALVGKLKRSVSLLEQLGFEPLQMRFSNWKSFFNDIDYGWGRPVKVGAVGNPGPAFSNLVFLVDSLWGKGIEATIILEEKLMAVLERDVNFLAFASPNQAFSTL